DRRPPGAGEGVQSRDPPRVPRDRGGVEGKALRVDPGRAEAGLRGVLPARPPRSDASAAGASGRQALRLSQVPRGDRRRQSGVRTGGEDIARECREPRPPGGALLHGDVRAQLPADPRRAQLMSLTVFTNAVLIDCPGAEPMAGSVVVVEDDRIKAVLPNGKVGPLPGPVTTLDCRGATLMPGLTDAHVHICAVEGNITDQHRYLPPSLLAAKAVRRAEECLMQGFTTVRDAGGADYGFREAINEGIYPGPRMLVSGNYISQTGGHGDKRRRSEWVAPIDCCIGMIGSIAD